MAEVDEPRDLAGVLPCLRTNSRKAETKPVEKRCQELTFTVGQRGGGRAIVGAEEGRRESFASQPRSSKRTKVGEYRSYVYHVLTYGRGGQLYRRVVLGSATEEQDSRAQDGTKYYVDENQSPAEELLWSAAVVKACSGRVLLFICTLYLGVRS